MNCGKYGNFTCYALQQQKILSIFLIYVGTLTAQFSLYKRVSVQFSNYNF